MADLDAILVSPAGNENGLFTDVGNATSGSTNITMSLGLDDEAAIPLALFTVVNGMINQPELAYRLHWYDGEEAAGTWSLVLRDDAAADGGTLLGWGLTVCEPEPPPICPAGTAQTTVFATDFEAGDSGFTHSGVQDEWQRGLPSFPPITGCNSGANCWKTDLVNTYNASSNQDLLSPIISLATYTGTAWVSWAQKYQIESATFDHSYVAVRHAGGGAPRRLWEWQDATMTTGVGKPSVTVQESAGWSVRTADIRDYLSQDIELLFHLDSDTIVNLAGLAIDDVAVMACQAVANFAASSKSVNTTTVTAGDLLTYTITLSNSGQVAATYALTDTLDPHLALVSAPGLSGTTTLTASGVLPGGSQQNFVVIVQANASYSGTVENSAQLSGDGSTRNLTAPTVTVQSRQFLLYLPLVLR